MIRINLLPFRAARKRENIKRQITIYALVVVFTIVLIGYASLQLFTQLSALKADREQVQTELATYKKTLDKIKELETQIQEIRTKLDVIKALQEGKTGPIFLLDQISTAVPKDKLWLTALKESKGSLSLTGTAMDNETIALFMDNLKNSEHITSVELVGATLREISEYNLKVSDFSLECTTYALKEKTKEKK